MDAERPTVEGAGQKAPNEFSFRDVIATIETDVVRVPRNVHGDAMS